MLAIVTTHPIQYQVPLWRGLAKQGQVDFEVWYLTSHAAGTSHDVGFGQSFAWDIDMLSGYPHRFLKMGDGTTPNSFWKCRARESLAERIKAAKAKAVWIQGWQVAGYWQAAWAAKKVGTEVWLRGESNDLAPAVWWKRPVKRLLLGRLFRHVDEYLYIGSANRRLYESYGVPARRLHPAPYAVDNERFAAQADSIRGKRAEIRSRWGIPENAFCVLFCGKFIPKKRPLDLVKAAQILVAKNELSALHLLFVGSGELGTDLRASCNVVFDADSPSTLQVTPNTSLPRASFAGFLNQTEISKAYVAADCLVLPSDYGETWGLVVNEAMASGLPCIISDQCGCAEDLGTIGSNRVYRCGDPVELGERVAGLAGAGVVPRQISPPSLGVSVETVEFLYRTHRERTGDRE